MLVERVLVTIVVLFHACFRFPKFTEEIALGCAYFKLLSLSLGTSFSGASVFRLKS
jgi:hypothetical protein